MLSFHDGAQWHRNDMKLTVRSMGKEFPVLAITTTDAAANQYMERHDGAAVMACIGPLVIMCSKYDGNVKRDL